jgi:hypothetical protein
MWKVLLAVGAIIYCPLAHAQSCKPGEVLRKNTQGRMQCVNGRPTLKDCIIGGVQLGYSKDAAERYCQSRNFR